MKGSTAFTLSTLILLLAVSSYGADFPTSHARIIEADYQGLCDEIIVVFAVDNRMLPRSFILNGRSFPLLKADKASPQNSGNTDLVLWSREEGRLIFRPSAGNIWMIENLALDLIEWGKTASVLRLEFLEEGNLKLEQVEGGE